ncbi:5-oxoprolinase subunit PxpB [Rhodobacter sp.]
MTPRFLPAGDRALMVEFATAPDPAAHRAVLALDGALAARPFAGFAEAVPALVTLLVAFDPLLTDHRAAQAHLETLLSAGAKTVAAPRRHEIPIAYDGPDLAEVAARTGLTAERIASVHQSGDYEVAMYGFAPGYAYLSGLPPPLHLDRKPAPVRNVPAGSVIIAGGMCLITTLTMPTGWWRIGHSPVRVLTDDPARPFAFDVGDHLRFRAAP